MRVEFPNIGAGELTSRLRSETGTGTWICVVTPAVRLNAVKDEIHVALGAVAVTTSSVDLDGTAKPLIDAPHDQIIIASGFETLSDAEWEHLDLLRSPRLIREQPAVLLMSFESTEHLIRLAPNVASFLGGQFFAFQEGAARLTEEERLARLERLRAQTGKTDAEVIELATTGAPLDEPAYAEWLVLLDRGDLLRGDKA